MRTLFLLATGLSLLAGAEIAHAQVTDGTDIGGNEESRKRTKEIRNVRQTIDDYPDEQWRNAAYLLVEVTPNEDGSASARIADKDRTKLQGIAKATPAGDTRWNLADASRVKLEINYYRAKQTVACSIPKKLRGQAVTLGLFNVYESLVECFVRPGGSAAGP